MDLSKLPKLSQTSRAEEEASKQGADADQGSEKPRGDSPSVISYLPHARVAPTGLAEAWISIAIGVILFFAFPSTLQFLINPTAYQQKNPVNDQDGNTIPYVHSVFFWHDLGATVFAATLIIEGLVLAFAPRRPMLLVVFALTLAAALFNVIVIVHVYDLMGLPIVCALGVAILVYMAITQWRIIQWTGTK